MEQLFKMSERGSSLSQEFRAGLTTFLAMSYIIALNPLILSSAGVPISATITSTCFGAGVMTILMGVFANRPIALASGLGINSMIVVATTSYCDGDWHAAMGVIFVEGVVILLLVLCGLREAIMDAIPVSLRHGISVGLGLFIAMIGLANAGIINGDGATLVSLGDVTSPSFILGVISIVATVTFVALGVKGALLLGILVAVVLGIPLGLTAMPAGVVSLPDFSSFGAPFQADQAGVIGLAKVVTTPTLLILAFSLMMSDFFDTMGTAMAVAKQGEFLTEDDNVENMREILVVDSCAAWMGGLVGASSITSFVESASGAADGGRTGLTSVSCGLLFILAAFFAPLIAVVPGAATCGALVYVGYLMLSEAAEIAWGDLLEGLPAFLIVAGIPMTYSISSGIGLGFIGYVVVALATGQVRKIKPLMWVAAAAFVIYFLVS
ncbi:NCS2 family permease [Olsenella massiliensis]|uniref:NCS2 family permease n=1 Tax=Olsenella massiliensis TaxID=1622075 RepID=UPI00071D393A|nr:NCS2 family permease [Olsenella massiliensis]